MMHGQKNIKLLRVFFFSCSAAPQREPWPPHSFEYEPYTQAQFTLCCNFTRPISCKSFHTFC